MCSFANSRWHRMKLRPFVPLLITSCISLSIPLFLLADPSSPLKKKGYIQQIQDAHSRKQQTTASSIEEEDPVAVVETLIVDDGESQSSTSSVEEDPVAVAETLTDDDDETPSSSTSSVEEMQAADTTMATFESSCCTCCYVRPECHVLPEAGRTLWASGEFLYWQAFAPSRDFAVSNNQPDFQRDDASEPSNGLRGRLYKAKYDWEPGFRVTVGGQLPHDCWELFADYTWYLGKNNKTAYAPPANGFQGVVGHSWPVAQLVSTIADTTGSFAVAPPRGNLSNSRITSDIHLHYQVADLLLARLFTLSKYIDLKITAGLQGAWLSQKWKVVNYNISSESVGVIPIITNTMNWSYRGGGLQIGANTNWYVYESLHVYLNGAFSMLYGRHSTHLKSQPSNVFLVSSPINDFTSKDMRVVTESQIAIGLSWMREFACSMCSLELFAGYELHLWTNVHEVYRNTDDIFQAPHDSFVFLNSAVFRSVDVGPLTVQGINVGGTLSF